MCCLYLKHFYKIVTKERKYMQIVFWLCMIFYSLYLYKVTLSCKHIHKYGSVSQVHKYCVIVPKLFNIKLSFKYIYMLVNTNSAIRYYSSFHSRSTMYIYCHYKSVFLSDNVRCIILFLLFIDRNVLLKLKSVSDMRKAFVIVHAYALFL